MLEMFFEIYISCAYIGLVLFCLMMEIANFRSYVQSLVEIGITNNEIFKNTKISLIHPVCMSMIFGIALSVLGPIGILLIVAIIFDYKFTYK